ncbi:glycine-rich protein 3-like isoform X3 [Ctenocephalides felis]|uniref:glycine-rich protein 3-like isoform X2 n=1 Tax=Ctenocephalides felis TaxID=7515 RepID=UPI000E6E3EE5|nr:glycine-rich protein 3-like isoform X2 [Ctenocephalides felis]XP_026474506.1 glycine-rich protein 3-like isoform X3 [Ctenocephalides felis]
MKCIFLLLALMLMAVFVHAQTPDSPVPGSEAHLDLETAETAQRHYGGGGGRYYGGGGGGRYHGGGDRYHGGGGGGRYHGDRYRDRRYHG